MKKIILPFLMLAFVFANAQTKENTSDRTLAKVLTLKIQRKGGANGASVAWHPKQKKYYAAMAGNVVFPLQVFDAKGKLLSDTSLEAMFDVRGLWYNPLVDALQGNGYDDFGWTQYLLDAKGMPEGLKPLFHGMLQPNEQSVGVFVPKDNAVYFMNDRGFTLAKYKVADGNNTNDDITLYPGARTKPEKDAGSEGLEENYNSNAIVYTGITGAEIGLLNIAANQIELYSLSSGLMQAVLKLPDGAPVYQRLNFSYSNGIYWLFDKNERTWVGYK